MYCLSEAQIEYILNDIKRKGVDIEDLQMNLLDHICCILEREMKDESDFEECYHATICRFYKVELKEIEQETINLLTFKNYYAMKKLMIASGIFSTGAFILGSFFKIMYWPGTGILLVLATFVFSLIFLPLVFILKSREDVKNRNKWILGIATLVGIMYCLSTLFMVQHWAGSRVIWLSTLGITFFILLPLYFFSGIRQPETKANTIVSTIILVGILGMQFTLTSIHSNPQVRQPSCTDVQKQQANAAINK